MRDNVRDGRFSVDHYVAMWSARVAQARGDGDADGGGSADDLVKGAKIKAKYKAAAGSIPARSTPSTPTARSRLAATMAARSRP